MVRGSNPRVGITCCAFEQQDTVCEVLAKDTSILLKSQSPCTQLPHKTFEVIMSNRVWTPTSAEKRCEASWHDELLDKYWMGLRCYLCLCHSGEHQYKWEEENETPEEYMKWLEGREECS